MQPLIDFLEAANNKEAERAAEDRKAMLEQMSDLGARFVVCCCLFSSVAGCCSRRNRPSILSWFCFYLLCSALLCVVFGKWWKGAIIIHQQQQRTPSLALFVLWPIALPTYERSQWQKAMAH